MMLAIAPHLVRREQFAPLKNSPDGGQVRATILDQTVTWPWTTDEKKSPISASSATRSSVAEFGRSLLDQVVETVGSVFEQLSDRQRLVHG